MNDNWGTSWPTPPKPDAVEIPLDIQNKLTEARLPLTNDGVLMLWERTKKSLEDFKALEMDVRKIAVKLFIPKPQEGTNTVDLGSDFKLKAVIKYNYNLASNDIVEACLDEIAKVGNEGAFIAERLVSWTPNFLITEYRKLQDDANTGNETAKQILAITTKMLTISEAAPTLAINEPKKKK